VRLRKAGRIDNPDVLRKEVVHGKRVGVETIDHHD
jgi:hypothetical protein